MNNQSLELSIKDLIIETAKIVRTECPIAYVVFNKNLEFDKHCAKCDWYVEDEKIKEPKCGWYIYYTKLLKEHIEYDDDDGTGALPFDDYYKYIKCYKCDSEVKHHSGYSWFVFGDTIKCKNCGMKFMYLGSDNDEIKFGIPYKQINEMRKGDI